MNMGRKLDIFCLASSVLTFILSTPRLAQADCDGAFTAYNSAPTQSKYNALIRCTNQNYQGPNADPIPEGIRELIKSGSRDYGSEAPPLNGALIYQIRGENVPQNTPLTIQSNPYPGNCATADRIAGYECSTAVTTAQQRMQLGMMTQMMGGVATQMGGGAAQMNALQSAGNPAAQYQLAGNIAEMKGAADTTMGALNGLLAIDAARKAAALTKNAQELEQAGARLPNQTEGDAASVGLVGTNAASTAIIKSFGLDKKINLPVIKPDASLGRNLQVGTEHTYYQNTKQELENNANQTIRSIAQTAAAEERQAAQVLSASALQTGMMGAQQLASGAIAIAQGELMKQQASQFARNPMNTSIVAPANPGNLGGTGNSPITPTAITGDGQPGSSGASANSPTSNAPPMTLGTPINTNPVPSGPPPLTPGAFIPSDGKNSNGGGGDNANIGGVFTDPAQNLGTVSTAPMAVPQDPGGGGYQSGGSAMFGSGGKGLGAEGGDNLSGAMAQILAGLKKEDPNAKTDIRFWGSDDQDMSTLPYTPYGKDADLIKRVSDRIRFEYQTGRVGDS
jgi:hypothetical protein